VLAYKNGGYTPQEIGHFLIYTIRQLLELLAVQNKRPDPVFY